VRRVAITGIGLVTPLGIGVDETWNGLVEGRSAVGPIVSYDVSSLRSRLGAEIAGFAPEEIVPNKRALRKMTRNDQLGLAAATLAARDSGLEIVEESAERSGLFVGSNKEISDPKHLLEATLAARNDDGSVDILRFGESAQRTAYPLFFVEGLQHASLFYVSEAFGLKGANTYFSGTAEAGATAIGRAYRAIRRGEADAAVAGGFDDAVSWWNMTKLDPLLGYLSTSNERGAEACRPFDRRRDGTVRGEGGAFFVLEPLDAATARGAHVYAEVVGFGSGLDTAGLLTPDADGEGLANAIRGALRESGTAPGDVGYVAAHGSGTRLGDASEAAALRAVFGSANGAAVSSVKAATGHLVAGAGALNVAVAALALDRGVAPPTLNLDEADPACDGCDLVAREAREIAANEALALARGLEGQNVALALRAAR
jgi:3-oxoacyl-[acyl-carrier-protein] synthase II